MTNASQQHLLLQDRYALRIAARLSGGLDSLPHDVSERLRASRMQALARRKAARAQPAFSMVLTGWGSNDSERIGFWGRLASFLPVIALAAGLVAINVIQSELRAHEIAEVDAAILTDDLPPSAYVDPGFAQFLKAGGIDIPFLSMSARTLATSFATAFVLILSVCAGGVQAQTGAPSAPTAVKPIAGPAWSELSEAQRQSLQPLAAQWGKLSEGQKRKWIALSKNYAGLTPVEQAKLHSRMTDWVSLSPQQRSQARLNFADSNAKQLSPDDKKAKWEAYQSLTPEQKKRLAERAAPKPGGAAATVKPVPPQKLTRLPKDKASPANTSASTGAPVDHNTLLPVHPAH